MKLPYAKLMIPKNAEDQRHAQPEERVHAAEAECVEKKLKELHHARTSPLCPTQK